MERLSNIIERVYKKYLPVMEKKKIALNLDFPDTTLELHDKEKSAKIEKAVDGTIKSAISRTSSGGIKIKVREKQIVISDTGTVLSKTACNLLKTDHIKVKSRVGFGTEVTIHWG